MDNTQNKNPQTPTNSVVGDSTPNLNTPMPGDTTGPSITPTPIPTLSGQVQSGLTPAQSGSAPAVPTVPPSVPGVDSIHPAPEEKPQPPEMETNNKGGKGKYVMMGLAAVFVLTTAVLGFVYWTSQNNSAVSDTQNSQSVDSTAPETNSVVEDVPTDASQVDLGNPDTDLDSINTDLNQL